ncbi:MAG: oxidoreductase [Phycisphaerae bacterium]|jgi:F420-non-reducing hydrogenase small subunit|nr:oxidoreductase [Phycisphaerae bacterium]
MAKPKVAFYWCASCGGCEETIVDLAEDILKVVDAVDIALWPVAIDMKRKDVEAWEPGDVAVAFINGAIRLSEQKEWVELLREKCSLVIAFGSCAHMGGIPGLANATNRQEIFANKYHRSPTVANSEGIVPTEQTSVEGYELELPTFWKDVKPLNEVIDVDYYLPGCPPPFNLVAEAVGAILEGRLPEKGAVLAPEKALCESCKRNETKPDEMTITEFKRTATSTPDPEKCFLADGFLCMGPATRDGCGERCINGNMPCRGCFGPPPDATDPGLKLLAAIASRGEADSEEDAKALADSLVDPLGTFYRFGLPASMLKRSADTERAQT